MLSVWIDFRLDMRGLKMRVFLASGRCQNNNKNNLTRLNLFFLEAWC